MSKPNDAQFNLTDALFSIADGGDKALIVIGGSSGNVIETWTYDDIIDAVFRVAGGLNEYDMPKGSRILMRIGNTPIFPMLFFGAIAAGYVPIPTSTLLTTSEVDYLLEDSGAAMVLADGSCALPSTMGNKTLILKHMLERLIFSIPSPTATTRAEDPAFMLYTSGTTGRPKGVLHAHRVILGRRPMREGWHDIQRSDRLLHSGAFNWSYTLGLGLMDPWAIGATSIIHLQDGDRPPELWPDLLEKSAATLFGATPGLCRRILKYGDVRPERFTHLRHSLSAGETLKESLAAEWTERTGRPIYQALGMTEIATYIGSSPQFPPRPLSTGKSNRADRVAILPIESGETPLPVDEVGVLAVHKTEPGLMLGYFNKPAETRAAFRGPWFITGDLARRDADGYIFYHGRMDDQMNAFGYRVAPEEVEQVISRHPSVLEVGLAETTLNDLSLMTAFVVVRPGETFDAKAFAEFAARELADYKRPQKWVQIEELPRNPYGKILRRSLRGL